MVVANKTSRYCWAYQAAAGTPIIDDATDLSFYFGDYNIECGDWNSPYVNNPSNPSWTYAVRTPSLIDVNREFPTFAHVFLPTSCQPYAWILKYPATGTPMTIVALETGMGFPMTIRLEESGGTNPNLTQASDCYCVGLSSKAERGQELMVEAIFAWGKIQDIGDEPTLTTAPLKPAGEAANEILGTYEGNPEVTYNGGAIIAGIWRADWNQQQDFEVVSTGSGTTQTVNTYKYKPVEIILHAVFEQNAEWDDYIDRTAAAPLTIKVWKHDRTHYILGTFTNARIISTKKTGHRNKGHYGTIMTLVAEKVEYAANWLAEYDGADGDFGDHFKAGI